MPPSEVPHVAVRTVPRPSPEPEDGIPDRAAGTKQGRPRLAVALVAIVLMSELAPMELTLVYPSLRHMVVDFRTPHIGWVLTIVSLSAVVTIPLIGKLADAYGKRRALLALGAVFAVDR